MSDFVRLSDLVTQVRKGQAGRMVREFRAAILAGTIEGIELADRVKLQPIKKGGKVREVADFATVNSSEFQAWLTQTKARLDRKAADAPTWNDLQAGRVDLQEAAIRTRERLARERARAQQAAERARRKTATTTTKPNPTE